MDDTLPAPYEGYDVLQKWWSMSFDSVTRRVLEQRLNEPPPPRFFAAREFATLQAACARLLATPLGTPPIANWIDADVLGGRGEGFRHPDMPPLQDAWRTGLRGLEAEAVRRHGRSFAALDGERQDETLRALHSGDVDPALFGSLPVQRFFRHVLLKSAAAHFYAQPQAWNEIGFGGPASPRGYVRLELDRRDPWEAPLSPKDGAR